MASGCWQARREPKASLRGQTIVELALLLPILTMLMLGALDLGRAFYFYCGVANAARVGAQYAMDPRVADSDVINAIIKEASPYIVLTADKITLTTEAKVPGKDLQVKVVFDYQFLTPGAKNLFGNGITMTCVSTTRYE